MNIYKFFIEQFAYQMKNSFNTDQVTSFAEYKKCLTFTGLLTALPVVGFILYLVITGIIINTGLGTFFPEYYLETTFLFFVGFPLLLLLALTPSYISYLMRFFKFKQMLWALSLATLIAINYTLYILCFIKVYSTPSGQAVPPIG